MDWVRFAKAKLDRVNLQATVVLCAGMSVGVTCTEAMPGYLGPYLESSETQDPVSTGFPMNSETQGNDSMSTRDAESSGTADGNNDSSSSSGTGSDTHGDSDADTQSTQSDDSGEWESSDESGKKDDGSGDSKAETSSTGTDDTTESTSGEESTTDTSDSGSDSSSDESSDSTTDAEVDPCKMNNEVLCGELCVQVKQDRNHCGECGHACGPDKICNEGECKPCEMDKSVCGNQCVNLEVDEENCGKCYRSCDFGDEVCDLGLCIDAD